MPSRRQRRVAEQIHKEISAILQFNIQDPRVGFVTVTEVDVSPDLKLADVYLSIFSGEEKEALAGLKSATPFLRRELGQKLHLRYTPELRFKADRSVLYGQKIESLLLEIDIPPEPDEELEIDRLAPANNDAP